MPLSVTAADPKQPSPMVRFDLTINVPTLITFIGLLFALATGLTRANDKIDAQIELSTQNQLYLKELAHNVNDLTTNTAVISNKVSTNSARLDRIENRRDGN